jgi:hypothetical protein
MRVHRDSPGGVVLDLVFRSSLPGHPAGAIELESAAVAVEADDGAGGRVLAVPARRARRKPPAA